MIDTTKLCKGTFGEFICIGGPPNALRPLEYSLFNFGGINATEPLDLGDPDIFQYLLVTRKNYIEARSKNIVINLEYNYKGRSGKLPWGLSVIRATKELESIPVEDFLGHSSFTSNYEFEIDKNKEKGYF